MKKSSQVLITEIFDKDFDSEYEISDVREYRVRRAARGIVVHKDKIALLNSTKENYHKLLGGGIEKGEDVEEAFKREVLEEGGCTCRIIDSGPIILEYRDREKLLQISYVFLAEFEKQIGEPTFEESEIEEGSELEWVFISDVEKIFAADEPSNWEGK